MTLKFFLKKQRSGNFTLVARFYHEGTPKDQPTGHTVQSKKDFNKDRVSGNPEANNLINDWKNKFDQYDKFCTQNSERPDIHKAVGFVCGDKKMKLSNFTIFDACDAYIEHIKETHDEATVRKYEVLKNFINEYDEYRIENIDKKFCGIKLDSLNTSLLSNIAAFDITKGNQNTTVKRRLTFIMTVLNHAADAGMVSVIPKQIQPLLKTPDQNRFALNEDELKKLKSYQTTSKGDRLKLDAFIFSCETGLRFQDLMNIKPINVIKDEYNKPALKFHMDKGSVKMLTVPLSLLAQTIINRYKKNDATPIFNDLPSTANNINSRLKDIFELAGLDRKIEINRKSGKNSKVEVFKMHKIISIHIGRHTYGTLMIQRGISVTDLKELMGHSKLETTMGYVHTDKDKAINSGREKLDSIKMRKVG